MALWSRCVFKQIKWSTKCDSRPTIKRTKDVIWKKRNVLNGLLSWRMRCLSLTRKMWRLIGTGRSWKRRKIVRSWQRILMCRSLLARRLSRIRTNWSRSSRTPSQRRTNPTLSWSTTAMTTLTNSLAPWSCSSPTWGRIMHHSCHVSKMSFNVSAAHFWSPIWRRLRTFSSSTRKPRRNSATKKCASSRKTRKNWRNYVPEMPMNRSTRRYNWRRKCRRWRSAWKTWRRFLNSMMRSSISITWF